MDVQLRAEFEAKVNHLAAAQRREPSEIVTEAIYHVWFIRSVEHGMAQANSGDLIPHDQVVARIEEVFKAS